RRPRPRPSPDARNKQLDCLTPPDPGSESEPAKKETESRPSEQPAPAEDPVDGSSAAEPHNEQPEISPSPVDSKPQPPLPPAERQVEVRLVFTADQYKLWETAIAHVKAGMPRRSSQRDIVAEMCGRIVAGQ